MGEIRLQKLPDRTSVRLTIILAPDLHRRLQDYATAYAKTYQVEEPLTELIPAILASFLDSDREFNRRSR